LPIKKVLGEGSKVKISAQNTSAYGQGAFTGEISADQLASAEIPYVILGHSERRTLFGETDDIIQVKVKQALNAGLLPIFCCGEPFEIRQAGTQNDLVKIQVETALFGLSDEEMRKVVIAYEPVWAIGTGLTASAQQAQDMHAFIRSLIAVKFGKVTAHEISILYGGSVKSSNAAEIFGMPDVDGFHSIPL
jgi:triosephosphate isomerase